MKILYLLLLLLFFTFCFSDLYSFNWSNRFLMPEGVVYQSHTTYDSGTDTVIIYTYMQVGDTSGELIYLDADACSVTVGNSIALEGRGGTITATALISNSITADSFIGGSFHGDGSGLTGVTAVGGLTINDSNIVQLMVFQADSYIKNYESDTIIGSFSATGNIVAGGFFEGNGAHLTGISGGGDSWTVAGETTLYTIVQCIGIGTNVIYNGDSLTVAGSIRAETIYIGFNSPTISSDITGNTIIFSGNISAQNITGDVGWDKIKSPPDFIESDSGISSLANDSGFITSSGLYPKLVYNSGWQNVPNNDNYTTLGIGETFNPDSYTVTVFIGYNSDSVWYIARSFEHNGVSFAGWSLQIDGSNIYFKNTSTVNYIEAEAFWTPTPIQCNKFKIVVCRLWE